MNAMTNINQTAAPYRVDISRGECNSVVSSQWFNRPADQRFTSLNALRATVNARRMASDTRIVRSNAIRVSASKEDAEALAFILPGDAGETPMSPTHWSFTQLCQLVGTPSKYMRQLPGWLAGINMQHALIDHAGEHIKTLQTIDGTTELRALTGPDYGRIYDVELVDAVQRIAGDGTGDSRWKVPGLLDWSTSTYNPYVDPTTETTTLFASDRDVFLFLVDDRNPIEAGRLPNGEPDLYFRGFYCWNSEVGGKTLGLASFYLRAVCANRNLWGVQNFEEITIRHSKYAASRFAAQAAPALQAFANSSASGFQAAITAARSLKVARDDDDRKKFLANRGFSRSDTDNIIATVLREEGHPPESVFDFVQGITAVARRKTHQDARLDMEERAKRLLDKAA